MKQENKSDRHLVVGSLEVLQEITGGAIRTIQTEIKDTAQTAKTLGADFKDFFTAMTFDNFISPAEKKILKKEHDQIVLDYPLVCAHAIELGIIESDSRFIAYKTAYENLYTYLYSTIQVFDEMEKETTLAQRSDFNDIWNAYYAALTTIQINVNNEIINGYSSGTQVENPDNLTLSSAIAEQHKIVVTANLLNQGLKNSLKKVIFFIQKTVGGVWEEYENESYVFEYFFDRATDGYPEAGTYAAKDLGNWAIKAKAVNIYGKVSEDFGNEILVNTDTYGTWNVLPPDVISAQSANRAANVTWQRKDKTPLGKDIYGISFYDIQISMNASTWFKPAQGKTGKVSEADWQDGEGQVRLSGGGWSQSLPLHNQTINLPENTTYYYRVRTRGITDDYLSAWSNPVTAIALATGIGDIIEGAVKEAQLDDSSVSNIKIQDGTIVASEKVVTNSITTELLNVLAKNKINNFSITGTLEGWTTTGTLEDDVSGFKILRITNWGFLSNVFTVQPNEICSFEFGIACPNYTSNSGAFIGLTVGQSFREYAWSFTLNKWIAGDVNSNAYFISDYKATTVKYFKTYILGSKVNITDIPAPSTTDATYPLYALQLQGSDTTARIRPGFNPVTAGTYWELFLPQIYSNQGGKIVAQQIVTPSLSAIAANIGEITSGILRSIIKAGESKPNVFLDLDTEEFRVGNNPSLEDSNHADAEYLHWKPNVGLFLKLKNLIVDAVASTIRGRFRVRGTTATMAQSVLIVNPESTVDPDTNTPANTTQVKQSVIANNVKLVTPLTGWWGSWNVLQHLESFAHGAIAWLNTSDGKGWIIGMHSDGRFIISRLTSKTTGYHLLSIIDTKEIQLDSKKAIGFADAFLRLNDSNAFTSGIWLGSSALGGNGEIGLGSQGSPSTARIRIIPGSYNGANGIVINGATGNINALGGLTGNVTGNVSGNLTGNVTGNVSGNLTGNVTGNASGSSSNVNSTNFFLNEDVNHVNLHTKNGKTLYIYAPNTIANLFGNLVNLGNSGEKVGILTANTSMYQPDATYPVSIGGSVHMNGKSIVYADRYHCKNNGEGDLEICTFQGSLPGHPTRPIPTIKSTNNAVYYSLTGVYALAISHNGDTTEFHAGTNTKLRAMQPFYGAVGNDICDNIKIDSPVKDFKYGYCYCELNGEYKRGNRGIIGITSDTASLHCGSDDGMEAGKDYLPIAIGGFVLAYVDKKYRRGTPLKAKKDGSLTRAYWWTPCWKIVATYQEVPREETWNKAKVNGRVIVRVK